MPVQPWVTSE
uniref:Uncharacterized protein n=1 Tax=Anguilla anguilla TaxID=7936 RepID=A0A0E9S4V4_ANGAN